MKSGAIILFDQLYNYPGWKEGEYKALKENLMIMNMNTSPLQIVIRWRLEFVNEHMDIDQNENKIIDFVVNF